MRVFAVVCLALGLATLGLGCKRNKPTAPEGGDEKGTPTPGNPGTPPAAPKKGKGTFTVGKATTHVTGPLDSTGQVDYAAALNERLSKGVTPRDNANVLIWKAIGPHPEGAKMPPGFFEKLGTAAPPETGDYFVPLRKHVQGQPGGNLNTALDMVNALARRPWKADEQPGIRSWLAANEKPLALVVEATKLPHYYSPLVPSQTERGPGGLVSALLPGVQTCRELAAALLARAMLYAGHGQADQAWQDILATHRLGRLVGRGGTLIEGLVGIAIEQLACRADVAYLAYTQPDSKQIEACVRDLRALPPLPEAAEKVDLGERFMFLDTVMQTDRQGLTFLTHSNPAGAPYPLGEDSFTGIDWNPVLENANKWFDRMAAAMREKDRPTRVRELAQIEKEIGELKNSHTDSATTQAIRLGTRGPAEKGRLVGDVLISSRMPAARKVQDAADRGAQTHENVIVAFAIAAYGRDTGRYPTGLNQLAPKYLPAVPRDVFTGKELIYRPGGNGYLLYSVGANGIDDGGRTFDDQPPGDDLVVRMPPR